MPTSRELGTVITTPEGPSTNYFNFVLNSDSVRKNQFVQLQTEDGLLVGSVIDITRANRYFERAESVAEYERQGSSVTANFPTTDWEYTVASCRALGVYNNENVLVRSVFPPAPGTKVEPIDESLLKIFLGLDENGLKIGRLQSHDVQAALSLDRLLHKHFAILAMSGAGKSHLASVIIEELLDRKPEQGRPAVIVVDVHGEYIGFAEKHAGYADKTTVIDGKKIRIGLSGIKPQVLCEFIPEISGTARRELIRVLERLHAEHKEKREPYDLTDVISSIELDEGIKDNIKGPLISWLHSLRGVRIFGKNTYPSLSELAQPGRLAVLDLSEIDNQKKKQIIVAYFARRLFRARKKERVPPFLLMIEESHNFAREKAKSSEFFAKPVIEMIAREGRKFGASLCLISQRPVQLSTTALSQCVAPDTIVSLNPHQGKSIAGLEEDWQTHHVLTYDPDAHKLVRAPITNYLKFNPHDYGKPVLKLTTNSGRTIVATSDHPFWVKGMGWTELGRIKNGDEVAVMPIQNIYNDPVEDFILVDNSSISAILPDTIKMGRIFDELGSLGLLPLRMNNRKLPIICRLLGHIFGDGTLHPAYRGSKVQHLLQVTFSGPSADLETIKADLRELGFPAEQKVREDKRISACNFVTRIASLWALLKCLGAPEGDKSETLVSVPAWLNNAPLALKREFLAAFLGSRGEMIRMGRRSAERIAISFSKLASLEENGRQFGNSLMRMLADFGIRCSMFKRDYVVRKDGQKTIQFTIYISHARENILRFCRNVGYRYSISRERHARHVAGYLSMIEYNTSCRKKARPDINEIPSFNDWLRQATDGLNDGLIWEPVVEIKPSEANDVRDITVAGQHSFFANGFLTHNCNTHIIMRVTNPYDLDHIGESCEGIDKNTQSTITTLRTGEALIVGAATNFPVFVKVRQRKSKKSMKGESIEVLAKRYEEMREKKKQDVEAFL